jgi:alpha/beta superfamily hydrolase
VNILRTEEEIDRLEAWAAEGQSNGTHYSGMSYEDGIRETLDWLLGRRDTSPADE